MRPGLPKSKVGADSGSLDRKRESAGRDREEDKEQPSLEISRLRTEIDATRDRLGTFISELDRRRHEALDLKLQARKHPVLAIGVGAAIAGAVAGAVVMAARARRRETVGRRPQPERKRTDGFRPAATTDPDGMLKLILKALLPIGIAVVTMRQSQGTSRRPPAA